MVIEVIISRNDLISRSKMRLISAAGLKEVKIRSVLTCETKHGVCRKCYGRNLATGKLVDIGEAIGIIAA